MSIFLDVGVFVRKIQEAMARIDVEGDVLSDVVQMIFLAAQERLRYYCRTRAKWLARVGKCQNSG